MVLRSRIPSSAICRVRGMGVAVRVMTSTSDFLICLDPFLVSHAEALLLVHDQKPQILEYTSLDSSRCVPMTISTLPVCRASSTLSVPWNFESGSGLRHSRRDP